ncbi:MAG: hypothetical protein K2Z81_27280, partial [Cyanobacteria bacterium]|nr:hypothetical protein [Cyanobacteriota bacterium]
VDKTESQPGVADTKSSNRVGVSGKLLPGRVTVRSSIRFLAWSFALGLIGSAVIFLTLDLMLPDTVPSPAPKLKQKDVVSTATAEGSAPSAKPSGAPPRTTKPASRGPIYSFDQIDINRLEDNLHTLSAFRYLEILRSDKALEELLSVKTAEEKSSPKYVDLIAEALLRTGKADKALGFANTLVSKEPKQFHSYLKRANVYKELKQFDKAIADFNKGLSLYKDEPRHSRPRMDDTPGGAYSMGTSPHSAMLKGLGACFEGQGKYKEAIRQYEAAMSLSNGGYKVSLEQTYKLTDQESRQAQRNVTMMSEALGKYPENSSLWVRRGDLLMALHQPKKAIADFSEAIDLHEGNNPGLFLKRAGAYYADKSLKSAAVDMRRVFRIDPMLSATEGEELMTPATYGDPPESKLNDIQRKLDGLILDQPEEPDNYFRRGIFVLVLKQFDRAQADFQQFISLSKSQNSQANENIARAGAYARSASTLRRGLCPHARRLCSARRRAVGQRGDRAGDCPARPRVMER